MNACILRQTPFTIRSRKIPEILVRDVSVTITSDLPVFSHTVLATTEGILLDLSRDLLRAVRKEDGGVRVAGGHFGSCSLKSGEE